MPRFLERIREGFRFQPTKIEWRSRDGDTWVADVLFGEVAVRYLFRHDGRDVAGQIALARTTSKAPFLPYAQRIEFSAVAMFAEPIAGELVHEVVTEPDASDVEARDAIEASWSAAA